jgi:hypothetical protein
MKIILGILLFSLFIGSIHPAKIVLANGRYIYGDILKKTDTYLELNGKLGIIIIPNEKIVAITDEKEPQPTEQISMNKWPFQNVEREILRFSFYGSAWKWKNKFLKIFSEKSFDYWNRVGEIKGFNGDRIEKGRKPRNNNWNLDFECNISKRIGIFQLGIVMGMFTNSSGNLIRINNEKYFDKWQLTGTCLGFSVGLSQVYTQQMVSGIEVRGNFLKFRNETEVGIIDSRAFFMTFKFSSGYIIDLTKWLALRVDAGYIIATRPKYNDLLLTDQFDDNYQISRPVFSRDKGSSVDLNLSGYQLSIGLDIKVLTKSRLK